MNKKTKYYQITESIDPKIIGRSGLPLTIEISEKNFKLQSSTYVVDFNKYFENKDQAYNDLPEKIVSKMYQKKGPVDIMGIMPHHLIILFVISEKVKNIFENLKVNKAEYKLKELKVQGTNDPFYFLFVPIHKSSETINFEKSLFIDNVNEIERNFADFATYQLESKAHKFRTKSICINSNLQSNDIIRIQTIKTYFSARIIDTFKKENVIGYDVIEKGDFKVDLKFS
ncbi:hypothetical protein BBI01_06780 [Chryseobacterium artocarpi]|uniref:Uncharacterized protein n=1 Tax=Chryseobacterium artocarpi TaxID=1414727 RepID=A0A1B8ZXR4_9FLAO|nr:hypothetical protein [Chryseobacterium artocarpi]OCA76390.1 hypothetical protein BBI01_06780 [Chryseobacterium artocarpi]